jgi:hypothetical protein
MASDPMSNDTLDLDALGALVEAMTPGPWETDLDVFDMTQEGVVACVHNRDNSLFFTIGMDLTLSESEWTREKADAQYDEAKGRREYADARAIVALRNAAPALLARARESATKDARIAALTAALRDALDLAEGPAIIEAATSDLESVARLRALLGTEGDNG